MKKLFPILLMLCTHTLTGQQCPDLTKLKKTALVIGNQSYDYANPLANPANDANDMRDALVEAGFKVLRSIDVDLQTMTAVIDEWISIADTCDVALFFYAGHGCQLAGEDYLFARDSYPKRPPDVKYTTYPLNRILDNLAASRARTKIVLIDACRNNPFLRDWSRSEGIGKGLASANASGTIVGFAAGINETAEDGAERNGTYTKAILKHIKLPNQSIYDFFMNVTNTVVTETKNIQHPFITSNLGTPFCFTTDVNQPASTTETNIAANVRSFLARIKFNVSLGDVLAFEFDESARNSFTYQSLPTATECTNAVVKYYWRYLRESKLRTRVNGFLNQAGISEQVTQDAYVVYVFSDNKLMRIDLRLYSGDNSFYNDLMFALSKQPDYAPARYKFRLEDKYYFISSFIDAGWNTVSISFSSIEGFNTCNNDWWTK